MQVGLPGTEHLDAEYAGQKDHAIKIIQRLERDICPWIGGKPIDSITAPQLLNVIR